MVGRPWSDLQSAMSMESFLSCTESAEDLDSPLNSPSPCNPLKPSTFPNTCHSIPAEQEDFNALHPEEIEEHLHRMLEEERRANPCLKPLRPPCLFSVQLRMILVSWISKACEILHFNLSTASLAVSLLDRFFATETLMECEQCPIQLVAIGCLAIAAKMEEVNFPASTVQLQVAAPWAPFGGPDIKRMELKILDALQWRTVSLTPYSFLDQLMYTTRVGRKPCGALKDSAVLRGVRSIAEDTLHNSLPEEGFLTYSPSTIAAAALLMGMRAHCSPAEVEGAYGLVCAKIQQVPECQQLMFALASRKNNVGPASSCYTLNNHRVMAPFTNSGPPLCTLPNSCPPKPIAPSGRVLALRGGQYQLKQGANSAHFGGHCGSGDFSVNPYGSGGQFEASLLVEVPRGGMKLSEMDKENSGGLYQFGGRPIDVRRAGSASPWNTAIVKGNDSITPTSVLDLPGSGSGEMESASSDDDDMDTEEDEDEDEDGVYDM